MTGAESGRPPSDGPPADIAAFNRQVVEAFRAGGGIGELGPVSFQSLVLLTTTGRRSGEPRTVPLGSERTETDDLILFASNMGAPHHPDWYLNLEADPFVTVEVTGATWQGEAVVLDGDERDTAYQLWVTRNPHVVDDQQRAGRRIPMVRIPPPSPS